MNSRLRTGCWRETEGNSALVLSAIPQILVEHLLSARCCFCLWGFRPLEKVEVRRSGHHGGLCWTSKWQEGGLWNLRPHRLLTQPLPPFSSPLSHSTALEGGDNCVPSPEDCHTQVLSWLCYLFALWSQTKEGPVLNLLACKWELHESQTR